MLKLDTLLTLQYTITSSYVLCLYVPFIPVSVNTIIALFSTGDLKMLAKEVSTMLSFKHKNVMSLIGVCIDGEMPLLIMPFMSNGNVLDYLKKRRDILLVTGQFIQEEVN